MGEQRHILVKGCGKSPTAAGAIHDDSQSAGDKSDDGDSDDEGPEIVKKELRSISG